MDSGKASKPDANQHNGGEGKVEYLVGGHSGASVVICVERDVLRGINAQHAMVVC